jgi:hypothetical protein
MPKTLLEDNDSEEDNFLKIARLANAELANPNYFSVFLPNRNKRKEKIENHDYWVNLFKESLTRINQGTSTSIKEGTWLETDNEITFEETSIIESYIFDDEAFFTKFPRVVTDMHRFGKETEQSAVSFLYNGVFYTIENYA